VKVTKYGPVFQTLILGRSTWNTSTKVGFAILFLSPLPLLIHRNALINYLGANLLGKLLVAVQRNTLSLPPVDVPSDLHRLARLVALNDDSDPSVSRNPISRRESKLHDAALIDMSMVRNWYGCWIDRVFGATANIWPVAHLIFTIDERRMPRAICTLP
jgi:hypothetical protein